MQKVPHHREAHCIRLADTGSRLHESQRTSSQAHIALRSYLPFVMPTEASADASASSNGGIVRAEAAAEARAGSGKKLLGEGGKSLLAGCGVSDTVSQTRCLGQEQQQCRLAYSAGLHTPSVSTMAGVCLQPHG